MRRKGGIGKTWCGPCVELRAVECR
jgi:hypothetical protein